MGSAKFEEIRKFNIVINDLKGRVNTLEIEQQKQSAKINQLELMNEEHKVKKLINQQTEHKLEERPCTSTATGWMVICIRWGTQV
jgi:hypothetical protein